MFGGGENRILGDLLTLWRQRADYLNQFGDPNSARLWMLAAAELEEELEVFGDQTLTLTEAARVSGFTAGYLGLLVKQKKLPNAGRTGAPRIRRADLPMKNPDGPGRPARQIEETIQNAGKLTPIPKSSNKSSRR
ncbi:MAG: hypothetical protein ACYSVY_01035 [Planctomycetota bacterium]|jgi:hypothetical protein